MQQANVCPLQVRLLECVETADRPFLGEAKLVISGANYERIEVMDGQAERQFRLPAGNFTITVVSSAATQITPASQQ